MKRCRKTFEDIEGKLGIRSRDEARLTEAFTLLRNQDSSGAYAVFLRHAKNVGAYELVLLCVLALGRSGVRNMRDEVRRSLPSKLVELGYHQSNDLKILASEYLDKGK